MNKGAEKSAVVSGRHEVNYPMNHSGLGKKRKVQQIGWWWSAWGGKRVWTWWNNPSGTFWRGPEGWWYEADSEMGGYNTKHENEAQETLFWRCCQWCTPANTVTITRYSFIHYVSPNNCKHWNKFYEMLFNVSLYVSGKDQDTELTKQLFWGNSKWRNWKKQMRMPLDFINDFL